MSKLFVRHFIRAVETNLKINLSKTNPKQLKNALSAFRSNYDLRDYTILHRFPRKDIKTLASLPCPVRNIEESKENSEENTLIPRVQTIASMKNLRFGLDIKEFKVCSKCPLKDTCSYKDQVPETHKANLTDLMVALVSFAEQNAGSQLKESEKNEKDTKNVENIENQQKEQKPLEVQNPQENEQKSEETLKKVDESLVASAVKTEKQEEKDMKEKNEEEQEPEFKFKYWNSGLKVVDSLSVILEDLYQNNGLESRRFINTFLEELSKSKQNFKRTQLKPQGKPSKASDDEEDLSASDDASEEQEVETKQKPVKFEKKQEKFQKKWDKTLKNDEDEEEDEEVPAQTDRFTKPPYKKFDKFDKFGGSDRKFGNKSEGYQGGDRSKRFGDRQRPSNRYEDRASSTGGDRADKFGEDRPNRYGSGGNKYGDKPNRYGGDRYGGDKSERYGGNRPNKYEGSDRFDRSERSSGYDRGNKWDNKPKRWDSADKNDRFVNKKPRYQVNDDDEGGYKRSYPKKTGENSNPEGFFEQESQVKTDKFMRNTQKDYNQFQRENTETRKTKENDEFSQEKPMRFKKRPMKNEGFPVVEKDDMLQRSKINKNQAKDSNFSFTETQPKDKNNNKE